MKHFHAFGFYKILMRSTLFYKLKEKLKLNVTQPAPTVFLLAVLPPLFLIKETPTFSIHLKPLTSPFFPFTFTSCLVFTNRRPEWISEKIFNFLPLKLPISQGLCVPSLKGGIGEDSGFSVHSFFTCKRRPNSSYCDSIN